MPEIAVPRRVAGRKGKFALGRKRRAKAKPSHGSAAVGLHLKTQLANELRSPLTNIIGFTHFLGEPSTGPLTAKQREYLGYINTSTTALLAIINDILDLATVDAGAMKLNLGLVDTRQTMHAATTGIRDRLVKDGLMLDIKARAASAGRVIPNKPAVRGYRILTNVIDEKGIVRADRVADYFSMSKSQLAETVGVRPETLHREKRVMAAKTQSRIKEMLEIVGRVADWAGGKDQAMAWYRAQPIPAFGGRTAESLVKEGKAAAVRDHLDDVALGGFA
jgi:uncharacterized protein (DUF2384 family)